MFIDGAAPVRPLAQRLGIELGVHHESTLGGYLSEQLGRVPETGETVVSLEHEFEIVGIDGTRISEVSIDAGELGRAKPAAPEAAQAESAPERVLGWPVGCRTWRSPRNSRP